MLAINVEFMVMLVMAIFGVVVIIWAVTVVVGGL